MIFRRSLRMTNLQEKLRRFIHVFHKKSDLCAKK